MTHHAIIAKFTSRPFTDDDHLKDDLGLDDIDRAGISLLLEEAYHIDITDAEIAAWQRVGDVGAWVARVGERVDG